MTRACHNIAVAAVVFLAVAAGSALADVGDYSSLYLWLRADQGVQTSGSTVIKWTDQSANGFQFVLNPSGRPALAGNDPELVANALNGNPVVRFDGGDVLTSLSSLQLFNTSSSPLTVFTVFKTTDNTTQRFLLNSQNGTTSSMTYFELGYDTGGGVGVGNFGLHRGAGNATIAPAGTINNNEWAVLSTVVKSTGAAPTNVQFAKNGTTLSSSKDPVYGSWLSAGSYRTESTQVDVGGRWNSHDAVFDAFHKGDIAEIAVFKQQMSEAQVLQITSAMESRWGIPEPATLSLLALGGLAVLRRSRR